MDIEEAIKIAKIPGSLFCGKCLEEMFSPMDKLSIALYGECSIHHEDDSHQQKNLLELSQAL